MFKNARRKLRDAQVIRRWRRRASRARHRIVGQPDAWVDLLRLCRRTQPAAILDIGSYIGRTVQRFADEVRYIPIHAFEPTPASADLLRRNTQNFANVRIHQIALAEHAGIRKLFINRFQETNSLLENAPSLQTTNVAQFTEHLEQVPVEVQTLDHWCTTHIANGDLIIKADMQGAEGLLLKGGLSTFEQRRVTAFYCEVPFADLYDGQADFADLHHALTSQFGMSLWQIYKLSRDSDGRAAWGDAMWVNENGLAALR